MTLVNTYYQQFNLFTYAVVLGRTKYMGLKFRIFGGFRWVYSSIFLDEPGLRRVQIQFFCICAWVWPIFGEVLMFGFGG